MSYILFLIIMLGSPDNQVPFILKAPQMYTTLAECQATGITYGVKTDLPIVSAGVQCEPVKVTDEKMPSEEGKVTKETRK